MTAFSDETGRGVKLTRAQFIMQMILDYARVYPGAKAKQAMPAAAKIYRDFTESEGIEFGDERYAWDANAAAVLVAEYEDVALEAALSASPVAQEPVADELLRTLREHHNWHLQAGTIGLQDGDGGWIEIDNGAEYSDSALYERTAKLLEGAPPEQLQPMPRGGMNTWWWEQAVLLRRKVRALEKAAQATPAGVGADEIAQIIATKCFDPRVIDSSGKPFWKKSQWSEAQKAATAILALLSRDKLQS